MNAALPSFEAPPVEEVALGAHFQRLTELKSIHIGRLAAAWPDYPTLEEQPEAPPQADELDTSSPSTPGFRIELLDQAPFPRIWFLDESQTKVRQLQRDRLVQNWRRVKPDDAYPHYEALRPLFASAFETLAQFVGAEGIGRVQVTQCEISYVNPIRPAGPFESLGRLDKLLSPWSGKFADEFLPTPDVVSASMRFPIEVEGRLVGRLHISAQPAAKPATGEQVLLLQVVARGRPVGEGLAGVLNFLDIGHEWIVRGFASATTPQMHRHWRRSDA